MASKINPAIWRMRKTTAPPPGELSHDGISETAKGGIFTDGPPNRPKSLRKGRGFEIYTKPLGESNRGGVEQCVAEPAKPESQGQRKENLLVLSTMGSFGKKTLTRSKTSKIPKNKSTIRKPNNQQSTIRKLDHQQSTPTQVQVPQGSSEGNKPVKQMPKLIPITKNMIFLPQ